MSEAAKNQVNRANQYTKNEKVADVGNVPVTSKKKTRAPRALDIVAKERGTNRKQLINIDKMMLIKRYAEYQVQKDIEKERIRLAESERKKKQARNERGDFIKSASQVNSPESAKPQAGDIAADKLYEIHINHLTNFLNTIKMLYTIYIIGMKKSVA